MIDGAGPVASLELDLAAVGVRRIVKTSARDMAEACQAFLSGVNDGKVVHRGGPELIAAIDGAATRTLGDGWALRRRGSSSDICPLVAAVLAHQGARRPYGIPLYIHGVDVEAL